MTSASLSALYAAPVDVISAHGRLVVVAANDMTAGLHQSMDDHAAHAHGADGPLRHPRPRTARSERRIRVGQMSLWARMFDFQDYGALVALVHNSIIAGALLGLTGGLIGVFVMLRDLTFAVHGISELSFAGASLALLLGVNIVAGSVAGSLIAAVIFGFLGVRAKERSSVIGVLMPFGLGLGVLFLSLYQGRSANKFSSLLGQIVAVNNPQLVWLAVITVVVLGSLTVMWRPLMFATVDPEIASGQRRSGSGRCHRSSWLCSAWRWRCRCRSSAPCWCCRC